MNKHNVLYLIWKNPFNRRNYVVGKLTRNAGFEFEYFGDFQEALDSGWTLFEAFPEKRKYTGKDLFAAFSSRLPDRKRRNIDDILVKYGLTEYDGFELLRKSGGKLPIDMYEFIDPIFPEDEVVDREFYIAGVRHLSVCKGDDCDKRPYLEKGMKLLLEMDADNEKDPNAVMILTSNKEPLGFIPRYYSDSITKRLNDGITYSCEVVDFDNNCICENCIKVRLRMPQY